MENQQKSTKTSNQEWKAEWDMGVTDEELVEMYSQVMKVKQNECQDKCGYPNMDVDEATFEELLDIL